MNKIRILFVCTFCGGRARIAELYTSQVGMAHIEVSSSGFEAGTIAGLPLLVMEEAGFNFPTAPLTTVFERYANSEPYDYVITLCDDASNEHCPMFLDSVDTVYGKDSQIINWSVTDFLALQGLPEEKLDGARKIRDLIKTKVIDLLPQL